LLPEGAEGASPGWSLVELGRTVEIAGGVALLMLARGLAQKLVVAWRWALGFVLLGIASSLLASGAGLLDLLLILLACLLFACRGAFGPRDEGGALGSPAWLIVLLVTLASGFWLLGRV
jgi:lysylphosphatidylglycerol synthetase-like protein (DUF2156 family)